MLKEEVDIPLNLEMAPTQEMLDIALEARPERVCLVPEKRLEITTEGGLDVVNTKKNKLRLLEKIIDYAYKSNIDVSLFIDPDIKQISSAKSMGVKIVELHTGNFCSSKKEKKIEELEKLKVASEYAHGEGIEVHAGHGINFDTVGDISKIKYITELNIGHFLIGEAIFLGLKKTIIKMRKMIRGTFNLSASQPKKLKEIIYIIKSKYRSKSKIINLKNKQRSFVISIRKIKEKLNFNPTSTEKIILRNI